MSINDELKIWMTGDYTRLSKEDGDKQESDSINNQKALIQNYVDSHTEFKLVKHYSDDGYTGVNFNRPGFQEMLQDIKQAKVNCVIVKDLSRFGRNYIETGRYLERIFPCLNVRFIAINDNYDSLYNNTSADQLLLPFKNLINDAYSRDISQKVRSHLAVKRRNGDFVSPSVPYGYMRNPSDRNHLVIDDKTADIVRFIFNKRIEGVSNQQIADYLNERQTLSPLAYKQANGIRAKTSFQVHLRPMWYGATIRRILEDEIYTGTLLQGKTLRPNYKIRKPVKRNKEDWCRAVNAHEAIISLNDFQLVQTIITAGTRQSGTQDTIYPLSGLIYCGNCRQPCSRKVVPCKNQGGKTYAYYGCYKSGHQIRCKGGYAINESYLMRTVLSTLRQYMNDLTDIQGLLTNLKNPALQQGNSKILMNEMNTKKSELKKYKGLILSLHEDYHEGLLTEEEYMDLKEAYSQHVDDLTDAINSVTLHYDELVTSFQQHRCEIDAFYQYLDAPALTRKIAVLMIKRIYIYPKNRIHILFRFTDEFNRLLCILPNTLSQGLFNREVNS